MFSRVETSYTHDTAWIGIFYGSWIAKKSAMKLFIKQLKAIEKTPALSEQFQAMNKIRAKSGYINPLHLEIKQRWNG